MSFGGMTPDNASETLAPDPSRMSRPAIAILLAASVGCVTLLLTWNWSSQGLRVVCNDVFGSVLHERGCTAGVSKAFTYSWALALLPLMLLLERWRPADPTQPLFSPGLLVDSIWFLVFPILGVWLPDAFERLLSTSFGSALASFRLHALTELPLYVQLLLVITVSDFLAWLGHFVRHKVPALWEFHKIHHSQVQLNYFSTRRLHPFDLFANSLVRFLPWTLLGLNVALPGYLIWTTFLRLFEMFVHSNIRTSLGVLRYVFVTPQTHRVHHSMHPEHIDKNFGDFFSVWDFLFRTQCLDFNVYPVLGVHDKNCPRGMASTIGGAIRTVGHELLYPLRVLGGGLLKRRALPMPLGAEKKNASESPS
jgi:sterol desaturase/sphingolipid hydroxylase (fatty acid hydroxylase superfamily)